MNRWKPVRKIAAALAAALGGEAGALTLYLTGVIGGGELIAATIAVIAPIVAGYFVPDAAPPLRGGHPIDPDPGEMK